MLQNYDNNSPIISTERYIPKKVFNTYNLERNTQRKGLFKNNFSNTPEFQIFNEPEQINNQNGKNILNDQKSYNPNVSFIRGKHRCMNTSMFYIPPESL